MTENQAAERQLLRRQCLAARALLSPTERAALSRQIVDSVMRLPVFQEKNSVFIYCSYQSEVETWDLIRRCLAARKTVCVPLTQPAQSRMSAVVITNPALDLIPGYKGIPEPDLATPLRFLPPSKIEAAVIPGAVFDRAGNRLGYGGGYYDRFLSGAAAQALRIGLAFSRQVADHLPALPHDVPMDVLVTEQEVFSWPRARAI
jgi:5-formyltetrahydrofolate cyclo-ligase